jgi:hypothetical protein
LLNRYTVKSRIGGSNPPVSAILLPNTLFLLILFGDAYLYPCIHPCCDRLDANARHCQSKFVYFAKTSEPDFAAIDFLAFFRVDLSGSMAAPSI